MDKSLKKLNRLELMQLLLSITETNEALLAENEELKKRPAVPPAPDVPSMKLSQTAKVGSIAEAALQANGYFEAAQKAADDYLREIKQLRDQLAMRAKAQARNMSDAGNPKGPGGQGRQTDQRSIEQIQVQAEAYIRDVQSYADNVIANANKHAETIVTSAQAQSDSIISQAKREAHVMLAKASAEASKVEKAPAAGAAQLSAPSRDELKQQSVQRSHIRKPEASESAAESLLKRMPTVDPFATGELMRRGRHVKLPNGAAV